MNCEEVLLAKMAELDGESTGGLLSSADAHVGSCENCRREIAEMRRLNEMFDDHQRVEAHADIWPVVQRRIAVEAEGATWRTFGIFAILLVGFKVLEMSFMNDPGWLFGLVPLVLAALLFALLKENPFKVNTELILESHHG